jgi:hypothetical protein
MKEIYKPKYNKCIFTHRNLDKEPFYYPPGKLFNIVPSLLGAILGFIIGAVLYFRWTWDLLTR